MPAERICHGDVGQYECWRHGRAAKSVKDQQCVGGSATAHHTGLRVNGPKDDAATFAIAQNMRGDIAGINVLKATMGLGPSTDSVAIHAGTAIADLLKKMKAKAVQACQAGLDSDSYSALKTNLILCGRN